MDLCINNDYFENIILYNSLINKTYLGTIIDYINPSFFNNEDNKIIFNIIINFFKKNNSLPNITEIRSYINTSEEKKAFKNTIHLLKILDKKFNEEELYKNTERFIKEKSIYNCLIKTIDNYKNNIIDTHKIASDFEKACNINLNVDLGHNYFKDINKHIESLKTKYIYIPTKWNWLDKKLNGGILSSGRALYIFCGITNVGKSIVLGNLATNILDQNKTVVIISLEMSEDIYSRRISTQLSKIPFIELQDRTDELIDFSKKYVSEHNKSTLIIKEYPPKTITTDTIKAYIERLKVAGINPNVIIVDYLNLLNSTNPTGKTYEDIKTISESLRSLSYIFKIPIISATQLNRDAINEINPGMETTSESIGISYTCDAQIGIWQNENDKELGLIHFSIMKNRMGEAYGTACFKLDYKTLSIYETDEIFSNSDNVNEITKALEEEQIQGN